MRNLTIFNRNYVDDPADLRDVLDHLFQVDIIDRFVITLVIGDFLDF